MAPSTKTKTGRKLSRTATSTSTSISISISTPYPSSPPFQAADGLLDDPAGHFLQREAQMVMTPITPPSPNNENGKERGEFPFTSTATDGAPSRPLESPNAKMADQSSFNKPKSPWPWSRRATIFDPPTALDLLLDSPLRAFVSFLYAILLSVRGAPFKPPRNKLNVRVICISDTHTNAPNIPIGDVLVHAGDLTNAGTAQDIQKQIDWLDSLPHREKIIIAGNHDSYFDPKSRRVEDKGKKLNFRSLHYLHNQSVTLKFKGGRKLNFYGSPDIPQCGGSDFAFQYKKASPPWDNRIPKDTDVLITHTPPLSHLDLNLGCAGLLSEIWKVRPRLHIFGHVHSGHGREAVFWDEGQLAYERLMTSKGGGIVGDLMPSMAWIDAIKVVFYGIRGILWDRLMVGPGGGNGGLMVNAALVWQSTTAVGNPVEIVEL